MKLNLTEEWCMAAAAREGDNEIGAGGMSSDFDLLIAGLSHWRNDDHADNINLNRHQIITLLDGIANHPLGVAQAPSVILMRDALERVLDEHEFWTDQHPATRAEILNRLLAAQPPAAPVEKPAGCDPCSYPECGCQYSPAPVLEPKTEAELDAILNSEDTRPCTVLPDGKVSYQVDVNNRPETPLWERRWPHDQPHGWNRDADKFLALVRSAGGSMWLALTRAKYLELRIDTRDCGFNLYDRDGKPLNPDEVVKAVEEVKEKYGCAAAPARSSAETSGQEG